MSWLDSITDSMDVSLSKFQEWQRTGKPGMLQSMRLQRVRLTEQLNNNNPLQYTCLEKSTDIEAWWAIVHRVTSVRHNLVTPHHQLPT